VIAWRVTKTRHLPFDGGGAERWGGRWNEPGHPVIYAADSFAGALLEILAHSLRPRTLPGPHHAVRIEVPDALVETLAPDALPGWDARESPAALEYGTRWLVERRSLALRVPAVTSRPLGHLLLVDPLNPLVERVIVSEPFPVPWDERLF
jgi:RES domain-containing protein